MTRTQEPLPTVAAPKVGFISLGCPKALVDSERILTQLRAEGYEVAPNYEDAQAVIVNTCGFITPAVEESLSAIGEALDATGKVIVTGCLGERPEKILERHPKVAAITGSEAVDDVMAHVRELLPIELDPFTGLLPVAAPGMRQGDTLAPSVKLTPRHYAYVKIAEGCNHTCSFCIIPKLRGRQVSRDAGAVLYEAYRLIAGGTKELMIISQDTSAYGVDLRHRTSEFQGEQVRAHLIDLAEKLGEMGAWVRMHYVYPYPHVERIVELMSQGKILPYLDVPLQHASPAVLKRMRRPGAGKQLDTIRRWREICPELVIRSTFIVGFPGETEEDFQLLLDFLEEARLDRVGAFTYSDVEEADANALDGAIPEEVKQERLARFMEVAQRISREKLAEKVGRVLDVIIDEFNDDEGDEPGTRLIGRTKGDAPGIDGQVYLYAGDFAGQVKIGDIVQARIEDSDEYDLYGEVIHTPEWRPNVPLLGHFGKH
ncbi:SSU ribosomal protein S12P methylthiotransferase [Deinococcus geothermalis DSM 11300]|uniref:Ribosomal protein uS12 methylthiotransferase RimO n=1 Tax=Deinococcus geothermalis (strain DSM 11300 / CIP 105573 / AG-3a) TaxID=319795 RepID=RIMO_DEIGD|nr:30S ribosomal protein S12 methylthiotransferase RimO [Deinococcus geothermalis]Q1J1F6.1 RecName: Full=Ribosomal protein uS12 methylthiotransferase RimO; Short=uS12 MTTase; Short=uS12 methylthiotransferase; AltName: Full=Ribosomal protein uS12 (aspartate-C(3))-methylthiotransferase; AltName: Full=Ribosome maturation factor RimO [Deinococcus geothermalis DSM 11300]ABF44678.1 SSU ribosomal protein S12P methylthiotransferase [Deinococcus geothermalis DSM 11300]